MVSEMRLDGRQRGSGLGKPAESVGVSHVQDRHGGRCPNGAHVRGGLGPGRGAGGWRYGFSPEAKEQVGPEGKPSAATRLRKSENSGAGAVIPRTESPSGVRRSHLPGEGCTLHVEPNVPNNPRAAFHKEGPLGQ